MNDNLLGKLINLANRVSILDADVNVENSSNFWDGHLVGEVGLAREVLNDLGIEWKGRFIYNTSIPKKIIVTGNK